MENSSLNSALVSYKQLQLEIVNHIESEGVSDNQCGGNTLRSIGKDEQRHEIRQYQVVGILGTLIDSILKRKTSCNPALFIHILKNFFPCYEATNDTCKIISINPYF